MVGGLFSYGIYHCIVSMHYYMKVPFMVVKAMMEVVLCKCGHSVVEPEPPGPPFFGSSRSQRQKNSCKIICLFM